MPTRLSPHTKALLQAILVTLLWSSSWVLIKIGLGHSLPALTFAGLRYTLAFFCLAPFVLFNRSLRHALFHLSSHQWCSLALLGLVYYTLTQGAMFLALSYLPANMLSLLLNLTSIFVGLAGVFFLKEYPALTQWLGITIALLGVGIYFLPLALPDLRRIGLIIGLVCLVMNVASSILGRASNRDASLPPLLVTFVSMGIGALILLSIGVTFQGFGTITARDGWLIFWLALANTALAFTLWNRSLQVLTAVESSIINGLMMPQIAILAFFFLGESLSGRDLTGLILVGLGSLVVQLKPRKNKYNA